MIVNRLILMYDDKTSAEYTYDAEGNMITKVSDAGGSVSSSNYVYDGYNRLSEFYSQNTEAQYSYNPEGLRESKTVNGNATRFLYDNGNIIGEFTGDDYYIYHRGTELIGYTSFSGKSATYQQNSHGNVTALLNYDGSELKTYTYNAYGKEQAFTANPEGNQTILYQWKNETDNTYNPFRYCGEYTDSETGLIYLRNRYYDPSIGRFITEDPARDGENWYVYCGGNPIMRIDPSGFAYIDGMWMDEYNFYLKGGSYISKIVGIEGLYDNGNGAGWIAIDTDGNVYHIYSNNVVALEVWKGMGTYSYSSDLNYINNLGYGKAETYLTKPRYLIDSSMQHYLDLPYYNKQFTIIINNLQICNLLQLQKLNR